MESEKNSSLSNGHLNENDTALYVDSLLGDNLSSLPPDILSHVEMCSECKDKILDIFMYLRNSQSYTKPDLEEPLFLKEKKVGQKNPLYFSRIAASFFILALIVFVYFSFVKKDIQQQKNNSNKILNSTKKFIDKTKIKSAVDTSTITEKGKLNHKNNKKSIVTQKQKNPTDPNFEVNPNLEYMINSQLRNISIQIFSPKNNSSFKKEINFSWEAIPNANLQIKILDNKNNVILQYSVKKNKFLLKEKLAPGLYYWKLENQSDLLYVGKFYIKLDSSSPLK